MLEEFNSTEFNNYIDYSLSSQRVLTSPNKIEKENENQKIFLITLKNYDKSLIDNDTNENHKNNLLNEYKTKIEKEGKLLCQKCGGANKQFYKCFDCELILCQDCKEKSRHDNLIEYELFNILVQHQLGYESNYRSRSININAIDDVENNINLEELKQKICKIKEKIDDIIDRLNKIKENLDFYYKVNCIINNNLKENNYEISQTNETINADKKDIIKKINGIISIQNNKFEGILNNLRKISNFKAPSNTNSTSCKETSKNNSTNKTRNKDIAHSNNRQLNISDSNNQTTEQTEGIVMKLKFEKKDDKLKNLRIFGDKFVENNKQCKMFIDNKNEVTIYNNSTRSTGTLPPYKEIKSQIDLKDIELNLNIIIYLKSSEIITNLSEMFCNCDNLFSFEAISSDTNLNITNMSKMFYNCSSLKLLNITNWNISNVTDINAIFYNCKKLDLEDLEFLSDIENWNTSNVTDMSFAFSKCESLKSLSKISNWNTEKVKKMNGMFKDCIHLKNIPNLGWNTSNVDNMNFMFCNCKDLNDISPFSNFNFSNVTDINNIFAECSSLKDISNFRIEDAPKVTDISFMFYNCDILDTLPGKLGFNENIIKDISYMFYNTKLKEEDIKYIKSEFLENNRYQNADKTEILKGVNKNVNCLIF
mgnify:CR=1 FL=1